MLGNRPEFAAAFYGILHAGAIAVLLDPQQSGREIQMALTNTGAQLFFFADSCAPAATAAARPSRCCATRHCAAATLRKRGQTASRPFRRQFETRRRVSVLGDAEHRARQYECPTIMIAEKASNLIRNKVATITPQRSTASLSGTWALWIAARRRCTPGGMA